MDDELDVVAAIASLHWRGRQFDLAFAEYEKLFQLAKTPFDQAKMLANIAQLEEKRGSPQRAIERAIEATKLVYDYKLYESLEGSELKGYLHGFLNRLQHKAFKAPLDLEVPGPLEMRLVARDRCLLHFAMGVIGATISAYVGTLVHLGQIQLTWKSGPVITFSVAGFLAAQIVTRKCFKLSTVALAAVTGKPSAKCMRTALGLITAAAIFCLLAMPTQLAGLLSAVRWFVLTGLIGWVYSSLFLSGRFAREVNYDPPNAG